MEDGSRLVEGHVEAAVSDRRGVLLQIETRVSERECSPRSPWGRASHGALWVCQHALPSPQEGTTTIKFSHVSVTTL